MLVNYAEQAAKLYCRNTGQAEVPERFIQSYCAIALMRLGFVVTVEIKQSQYSRWLAPPATGASKTERFSIDLVIFDPDPDGNPDHAKPRAIVKFKKNCWEISKDIRRTELLTRKALALEGAQECMFGFVIACSISSKYAKEDVEEVKRIASELNVGNFYSRLFTENVGNGYRITGYVVAVECGQAEWPTESEAA